MIMKITKWGFGAAPFKEETENKYRKALVQVRNFIDGNGDIGNTDMLLEQISVVKGLFNRTIKQDQWDWFTVYMYFDYPSVKESIWFVSTLAELRTAIKKSDQKQINGCVERLKNSHLEKYISNFLNYDGTNNDTANEYIYILSRREEKELLKVGMTTRNVIKRCKEINSATGVVYPFSPRKVFRVTDAKYAEQCVHQKLEQYRVRADREFFVLPYKDACQIIEDCLKENNLLYYKY